MRPSKSVSSLSNYYFADKLNEVRAMIAEGKDVINLGIGNPDIATPPEVIHELKLASEKMGASQYQPYRGIIELREAFASWYKRIYGIDLSTEQVLPLIGSKEAIMHIHLAFCNPGDSILIPNPGYPTYAASAKLLGLNAIEYNLREENGWLPSIQELDDMNLENCKVMWISYPHMPTGAVATDKEIGGIVAFAKKHGILLVNDNPYSLILNDNPLSALQHYKIYPDIVELNSLSKIYNMPGWRVGVVVGSAENINHILKVKSNFDSGMFKPIQLAAIRALQLEDDWFASINEIYGKRQALVYKILDQLNCSYNPHHKGMFVWAKVGNDYADGKALSNELLYNKNIFAPPGEVFGSNGNQYIRFSLCVPEDRLNEALNRI